MWHFSVLSPKRGLGKYPNDFRDSFFFFFPLFSFSWKPEFVDTCLPRETSRARRRVQDSRIFRSLPNKPFPFPAQLLFRLIFFFLLLEADLPHQESTGDVTQTRSIYLPSAHSDMTVAFHLLSDASLPLSNLFVLDYPLLLFPRLED